MRGADGARPRSSHHCDRRESNRSRQDSLSKIQVDFVLKTEIATGVFE